MANVVAGRIGQILALVSLGSPIRGGSDGSPDSGRPHFVHSGHHDPSTDGTVFSHSVGTGIGGVRHRS